MPHSLSLSPDQGLDTSELSLPELRSGIDEVQQDFWEALGVRFDLTRLVGVVKVVEGLPVVDEEREAQVLDQAAIDAEAHGVNPDLGRAIMRLIIDRVVEEHQAIARGEDPATLVNYTAPAGQHPDTV